MVFGLFVLAIFSPAFQDIVYGQLSIEYTVTALLRGGCAFKHAVIHYPKDEKVRKQIEKDIAIFHCCVALKYVDSLHLNSHQKIAAF